MPQGPREGTFALGECETSGRRVQVRPPAGCGATRVGCDEPGPSLRTLMVLRVRPCDDPQQLTLGGSLSTSDARPYGTVGARRDVELWNHRRPVYRWGAAKPNSQAQLVALNHHGSVRRRLRRPRPGHTLWLPHYLPMWSSREATLASYRLEDSCLVLDIPPDRGLWLPEDHHPPLRLSGVQSGNRSGPVGSTDGQQAVYAGQLVREEQPAFAGHLQDRRAPRDPLPDDDLAAVDGGALAVRLRGAARPLRGDLRDGGLRQGRGPGRVRRGRRRAQADPRPQPRPGLRRPAPADRRRRVPHLRRRLGRHGSGLQRGRRGGTHAAPRRRPTRCR